MWNPSIHNDLIHWQSALNPICGTPHVPIQHIVHVCGQYNVHQMTNFEQSYNWERSRNAWAHLPVIFLFGPGVLILYLYHEFGHPLRSTVGLLKENSKWAATIIKSESDTVSCHPTMGWPMYRWTPPIILQYFPGGLTCGLEIRPGPFPWMPAPGKYNSAVRLLVLRVLVGLYPYYYTTSVKVLHIDRCTFWHTYTVGLSLCLCYWYTRALNA